MYLDGKKLKVLTINNKEIYRDNGLEVVVEVFNKYTNSVESGVRVFLSNGTEILTAVTDSFGICKFMPGYGEWTISCECSEEYSVESKVINLQQTFDIELLQIKN